MVETVYTIGHSTHPTSKFIALLHDHAITAVCDVRSKPYSRLNPQFNREILKDALRDVGIRYVFLGKELGARSEDKRCYVNGKVQYDLLARTDLFKHGIQRVITGAHTYRVALMCAEKEPLDCHRTILVARYVIERGVDVKHILADGEAEEHRHAIKRLLARLGLREGDLFKPNSEADIINEAYLRRGDEIAYRDDDGDGSELQGTSSRNLSGLAP